MSSGFAGARSWTAASTAGTTPSRFLEGLPPEHVESYQRDDDAPASDAEALDLAQQFLAKLRGTG